VTDVKDFVVSDLGLSKIYDSDAKVRRHCGTERYMAPELFKGVKCGT
jgi:serine/threonine protein kinase